MSGQGSRTVVAESDDRGGGNAPLPLVDAGAVDLAATVISVAHGDQRALSVLQEHLSEPLHRVARRIVRSHECAQEVVGDVFVYVWKNAGTYDATKGTVIAWLSRVTRNRAIDRLRSSRRHRLVNERLSLSAAGIDFEPPDDVLSHFQHALLLHQAIGSLSSLRQQLLALSFFEELSHEEISSRIDLPLGTVKSHLRRALQVLHSKLERDRRSEGYNAFPVDRACPAQGPR